METNVLKQRSQFVRDFQSGHWSMTELCERYGVTRPTGYKWVTRHRVSGDAGLANQSRAPHACPHRTSGDLEALIVTLNAILERYVLLHKNRRRRKWTHPGATPIQTDAPNQVWPADFKGQFKTGDGQYCYPLTVTDHFSRALLVCRGLPSVKTADAKPVFRALCRTVGLPDAIRNDNGTPFASTGGSIDKREALRRLGMAGRLGIRSVPIRRLWRGALARAMNSNVATYDTLFVELAVRERKRLVTFDAKLLTAFPNVAVRPAAVVGN